MHHLPVLLPFGSPLRLLIGSNAGLLIHCRVELVRGGTTYCSSNAGHNHAVNAECSNTSVLYTSVFVRTRLPQTLSH